MISDMNDKNKNNNKESLRIRYNKDINFMIRRIILIVISLFG